MASEAAPAAAKPRRPFYRDLSVQVFLGMLAGALLGYLWPSVGESMQPLGDLFIRLVRMVVAPIIFCTVVHGIASVGEAKRVGRVAIKSLIYFEIVTTLALILALVVVNFLQPGAGMNVDVSTFNDASVLAVEQNTGEISFGEWLLHIVPASAVGAFADGDVLPVLFFSMIFAFALLGIGEKGKPILDGIGVVAQVFFKIIALVMYIAPIGAFGAIAFTVGRYGPGSLLTLGVLVGEFYVCCLLFVFLILFPIAIWFRVNFFELIRYFRTELMIVFGTSSSESVFPRLHSKLRKLGVDEAVVSLVLPSGYAFNHDGTCLYFAMVSVFLAQAVGIDLSLGQQLSLLAIMLVTSKGGAGVAGSAIVILASTLEATNVIPVASIGLILGVHRLLSSAFVPVNVLGNALATIVIGRLENAVDKATFDSEMTDGAAAEA
jgi:aerobic C4-dicarboxylate transport protein